MSLLLYFRVKNHIKNEDYTCSPCPEATFLAFKNQLLWRHTHRICSCDKNRPCRTFDIVKGPLLFLTMELLFLVLTEELMC
jgi:hypothetical protein